MACQYGRDGAFEVMRGWGGFDAVEAGNLLLWDVGRDDGGRAAQRGRAPIVRALLEVGGVDVNGVDEKGNTPLINASRVGHGDVVREVLGVPGLRVNQSKEDSTLR